jgi:hypothetical protein
MKSFDSLTEQLFPGERLNPDFPLAIWFAGLWCYFKAFLYLCYVYMLGLEPPPYSTGTICEVVYFGITMIPFALLGYELWHRVGRFVLLAVLMLAVDTPILFAHVWRLGTLGFLDSTLTKVLEFGGLLLNVVALSWLLGYMTARKSGMRANSA